MSKYALLVQAPLERLHWSKEWSEISFHKRWLQLLDMILLFKTEQSII